MLTTYGVSVVFFQSKRSLKHDKNKNKNVYQLYIPEQYQNTTLRKNTIC